MHWEKMISMKLDLIDILEPLFKNRQKLTPERAVPGYAKTHPQFPEPIATFIFLWLRCIISSRSEEIIWFLLFSFLPQVSVSKFNTIT